MAVSVTCECGKRYRVTAAKSGRRLRCKNCGRELPVGNGPKAASTAGSGATLPAIAAGALAGAFVGVGLTFARKPPPLQDGMAGAAAGIPLLFALIGFAAGWCLVVLNDHQRVRFDFRVWQLVEFTSKPDAEECFAAGCTLSVLGGLVGIPLGLLVALFEWSPRAAVVLSATLLGALVGLRLGRGRSKPQAD